MVWSDEICERLTSIDHYRKQLDASELNANHPLLLDWDGLRKKILSITVYATPLCPPKMPCRDDPVRSPTPPMALSHRVAVSVKSSKDGVVKMVVRNFSRIGDAYEVPVGHRG